jgi:DNA polymerase III alpha subunit (gram-positive type)
MIHTQAQLSDLTLLAFDSETTDLFPITHRLVEVGSIRFRVDGRELATLQTLIGPELPANA